MTFPALFPNIDCEQFNPLCRVCENRVCVREYRG